MVTRNSGTVHGRAEPTMDEAGQIYDGFISYSHAADDLLAPRLQSALQRFAKPWWKRRAVRIFRDESSLSANPHLWSSITEALDTSGWFVLLLSPDAAQSEWVNQEIAYWVDHRDPNKILPVTTDGIFGWIDGDVSGDAVPDALRGVFSEEPRWVDVRWVKDEDQLDLQDPRFADAVADIASTIRGIPKDDLASEEVRQHRRTVRTAWAAGGLVTILAIAAVGFGIQSARNANEAERQARIAAEQADIAEANADAEAQAREEADANAAAEAEARADADQNANLARSRELSAAALTVLEDDPELATRLVVHGASLVDEDRLPVPVVQALWDAGISNKLVEVVNLGQTLYTSMALSRDGSFLVAATANGSLAFPDVTDTGRLVVFDALTMEPVWEWMPDELEGVLMPDVSYDGRFLAVATNAPDDAEDPESRLEVFELATGRRVATLQYSDCVWMGGPAWSPDGSVLAITTAESPCERPESSTGRWVELLDTTTWETIRVDELPATQFGSHPEWSDEGELYIFGSHPVYRYGTDLGDPEVLETIGGFGDISPDGSLITVFDFGYVGSPLFAIYDAETLQIRDLLPWDGFPRFPVGAGFTEDGGSLYVAQEGAKTVFFDVETGSSELVLPTSGTDGVARDEATGRIYTSHNDGTVKVWNASGTAYGVQQIEDLGDASWVNGNNSFRPGQGITGFDHWDIEAGEHYVTFFDQATGEFVLGPIPSYTRSEPLADGRFVLGPDPNHLVAIDPQTGDRDTIYESEQPMWVGASPDGTEIFVLVEEEDDGRGVARWLSTIDASGDVLEGPEELEKWPLGFFYATDDTVLLESWQTQEIYALDRATGEELWRDRYQFFVNQLTEHGFEGLGKTRFSVVDIRTGGAQTVPVEVDRPRGFEVSPDRSLLAVGDVEKLRIIDLTTGDEVQSVPIPLVSDIHWIDDENVVIGSREGAWARLSLNPAQLLAEARASLSEGFTEGECALYAIDPCPTLAELRGE